MSRIFLSLLLAALITGCNGVQSEFKVPNGSQGLSQKPRCSFKVKNNCWQKSVALLVDCMDGFGPDKIDRFSDDLAFCENKDRSKKVIFKNKLKAYKSAKELVEQNMGFSAYHQGSSCFQFSYRDSKGDFIFITPLGELSMETLEGGDKLVRCLDGSEMTVPKEAATQGCAGVPSKASNHVPGIRFSPFAKPEGEGWFFQFLGLSQALGLFQCYE